MTKDDRFKFFNKLKKKSYSKTKKSKAAYDNDLNFQRNGQVCRRPQSKVFNLAGNGDFEETTFKDYTTTDIHCENIKDLSDKYKSKSLMQTSKLSEIQLHVNENVESSHKVLKNITSSREQGKISHNITAAYMTSVPKLNPTPKNPFPKSSIQSDSISVPKVSKKSFFGKKGREYEMAQLRDMKSEINIDDHLVSQEDLYAIYKTDPENGLSEPEVMKRINIYGPNTLPQTTEESNLYLLAGYIFKGFSALLWFGAVLSFMAYIMEAQTNFEKPKDNLWLGIILVVTCVVTGIFSYYQEMKGSQILDSFKQMIPTKTTVIRDGTIKEINASGLVTGDIVLLTMGDKVPADIRLVECNSMKVENSSLTGEVEPVSCSLEPTNSYAVESRNLVFFSTNIVSGYGKGVVILTGSRTVMGKIAGLTNNLEKKQTPIELEIHHFIRTISTWALFLGLVCFILAMCVGYNWLTASVYVIAIIVANVPEGLLATLTVSLTLTAKRLAEKNCIVKRLQIVETLGSIRTICSDKTGTLTQNKMKVVHIGVKNKAYEVSDGVTLVDKSIENDCTYKTLLRAACLCSQTDFELNQDSIPQIHRKTSGDATEVGITHFVKSTVKTFSDVKNAFPKVAEIPFNSLNKYSMTIHLSPLNQHFVVLKGAPEVVMEKCTAFLVGEKEYFFTAEVRYDLEATIRSFASRGERVIAFGDKYLLRNEYPVDFKFKTDPVNFPTEEFRFIGLISLFDPPKHEVPRAIAICREAGIRVIMVTGDHPLTARSIAIRVNILSENAPDESVVSGMDLRKMSDLELRKLLYENEELIFARTSPIQKLKIVEMCQSLDEIVAVIGDGVNDAPALKKADIGIAMGITGSDVSKQTADMILMDDNFATIISGIEEGRLIFDNLKKSIAYVLASNIPEIAPFLAYIFLGIPLPVSTVTVLCIDLGTDMWPAISLAYEKPERNILKRRSRNPKKDRLVSRRLVMYAYLHIGFFETLAGFLTYFHVLADAGWLPHDLLHIRQKWESKESITDSFGKYWSRDERMELEYTCQTAYFIAIVIAQWADVIICKTRYNSIFQQKMNNIFLNLGIIFETLVACFVAYSPYVNNALRTRPVSLKYWITPLPMAVFIIMYDEVKKAFARSNPRSIWAREFTY